MKKLLLLFLFLTGLLSSQIFGQQPTVPAAPTPVKSRDIQIKKGQTLLNLPVSSSGRAVRATVKLNGKAITQFSINLSDKPDFWTFFDVSPYQGKTLTLEIGNSPQRGFGGGGPAGGQANAAPAAPPELNTKALDLVFADIRYPGQDSVYKEKGRPQVHFSSQRGHINDPNGLLYYKGEYHLFYQHNPYGNGGGNQHWGHAVSKDLLHWIQLPEAIYPYMGIEGGRGDLAFSGSATWDPANTAGFRKNGIDPLIAFYTSTGRGECIKLSYDNGRTFVDYEGNPILKRKTQGRDPKILWYAPGNQWVMVVWDGGQPKILSNGDTVRIREHSIFTSPDMKKWTYQSGVPGFFECPDLFELPVEGQPGVSKWVMYDASGRYVLGSFDGKKFTVEQPFRDYVYTTRNTYYAAQTFNNSPDGRRVQIAWVPINFPGMPFTCGQGFPTELKLRKTYDGFRLTPTPIKEISSLYKTNQLVQNKVVTPGNNAGIAVNPDAPIHVIAEIEQGDAPVTLSILGYELRYDNEWQFTFAPPPVPGTPAVTPGARGGAGAGASASANNIVVKYVNTKPTLKIEVIRDKNILEVYVNDGELYNVLEITGTNTNKVEALVSGPTGMGFGGGGGGGATPAPRKFIIKKLEVHELNSIWPKM